MLASATHGPTLSAVNVGPCVAGFAWFYCCAVCWASETISVNFHATQLLFCFWATVCKTVRPTLSDRCQSVLSVCNVGVLWPNGWTDQDETWHAGIGLGPGHIVLDRDPAPPPKKAKRDTAPNFRPMSIVAKRSPISATAVCWALVKYTRCQ